MPKFLIVGTVLMAGGLMVLNARTAAVQPVTVAANDETKPKPREPQPLKLPSRKDAMQMKLKSSQAILEGIALSDFKKIQNSAEELVTVSIATDFMNAYKGQEYQFHVEMMRRPAENIAKKAKDKNMDGVMLAFNDLTLSCLKCHQGMKLDKFEITEKRQGIPGAR